MLTHATRLRAPSLAGMACAVLLAASPWMSWAHAEDASPRDRWHIITQSPYGFTAGGSAGSFNLQGSPVGGFTSFNGTRGFVDYSLGHGLGFTRDLGVGSIQATIGARAAEPLVTNGFTPPLEQRRYLGIGPRLGLAGSKPLESSWVMEWQVGAAALFGDRTLDAAGGVVNSILPNYSATGSKPVVNVDGLLGLSYWFNTASKLTLGYRADAYFNASPALNAVGAASQNADRIDHGPTIRFTIQK